MRPVTYFSRCMFTMMCVPKQNFVMGKAKQRLRKNESRMRAGERAFRNRPLLSLSSLSDNTFRGTIGSSWQTILGQTRIFPLNLDPPINVISVIRHVTSHRKMQEESLNSARTAWNPFDIFQYDTCCEYAVIVLNRPIYWKRDIMLRFWQKAQITVTVDGGAYRWLKYLEEHGIDLLNDDHKQYVPDLITGDMDSCPPDIIEKLRNIGSTVVKTPDQNHTDYTKALLQVAHYAKKRNINLGEIYVVAETSGRFDHIIGNINTLYKSNKLVGNVQVIQIASNSLTWSLKPGLHTIYIPEILVKQHSWCGLLPFGCPVNCISTSGLKWNLNNTTMQFGGLVSTSNTYDNLTSEVTINTDTMVIWTMGIEPFMGDVNNDEITSSIDNK